MNVPALNLLANATWWQRLRQPERAATLWLGTPCVIVAWLGLLLAVASPPQGLGLPVCWFQNTTGVPCPGCGMTRSLSCALHGMFTESWNYHPMGSLILALFVFTAGQSLLPKGMRGSLRAFIQERALFFNSLYLMFVTMFLGYGAGRALFHCATHLLRFHS